MKGCRDCLRNSLTHQSSKRALEAARDWPGGTTSDFSAVDGRDWNDFGAGAEHEEFLESPQFAFEAGLEGGANGFLMGQREDNVARDARQKENGEWRSHQIIVFHEQDAGTSAFLKDAVAAKNCFVRAGFSGLLAGECVRKQADGFDIATSPTKVRHDDGCDTFFL